jgi:hypothetical protein
MYAELLAVSLDASVAEAADGPTSVGAVLAELFLAQGRLRRQADGEDDRVPAVDTVTAQLHYDVTLLRLCSLMGITCDPTRFTQPSTERQRIHRAMADAGLHLDHLGVDLEDHATS